MKYLLAVALLFVASPLYAAAGDNCRPAKVVMEALKSHGYTAQASAVSESPSNPVVTIFMAKEDGTWIQIYFMKKNDKDYACVVDGGSAWKALPLDAPNQPANPTVPDQPKAGTTPNEPDQNGSIQL